MNIIFITSLSLLLYTFIGYPLILRFIKKEQAHLLLNENELPEITVVISIYNSAHLLESRIQNIFSSDYPTNKINILVISDGSTDEPEKIVDKLDVSSIKLIHYSENMGKSYALSYGFKYINTPYVAFTDIRQSFKQDALKELASKLMAENIGAVSGNLHIVKSINDEEQGLYWKYEKAIRTKESDLNSLLGVTGAIYMAKTNLLPDLPNDSLLDDMYIPLSIVKQGYKVKFCENAIAYDKASNTVEEEFTRKVRTLAGNYQLIKQLPWLMSITKNPLFFQFISHKVARLLMPFALILLFVSSFYLTPPLLYVAIISQCAFYGYALLSYKMRNKAFKLPLASTCISFCSLNLAALIACWKYFTIEDVTELWKKH